MSAPAPRAWWIDSRPAPGAWPWQPQGTGGARAWLRAHGLRPGARLGVVAANRPALVQLIAAAARAGITLVLFNRRLLPSDLAAQIDASALDALAVGDALPLIGTPVLALPDGFAGEDDEVEGAHADAGLVVYTSGTTGAAKAVRLPWATLHRAATDACAHLGLDAADAWLACLPLDHIGGASIVLRAAMAGFRIRLHERFATDLVADDLDGGGLSGASLVPTMLHRLLAERTRPWHPRLRHLLVGGGALAPTLAAACRALGVTPAASYGLTEAASQVCTPRPGAAVPDGCVGPTLPGVDLAIVDPGPDGVGAIAVRGPHLFAGYEHRGQLIAPHPPGAWFTTGDLGRMTGDGLVVLGRRDEVIVSGGEKISPDAVEAVLRGHPAVAEAMVHGVADPEWGQVVAAQLVARGERPTDADFAAWLATHLAGFRRPRRWAWVDEVPRTALGKPRRGALGQAAPTSIPPCP